MSTIHDADELAALARAAQALAPDYGGDDATLVTLSENATFRIDRRARPVAALRFYRPGGRTAAEIAGEIAWIDALRRERVVPTARPLPGRDGTAIRFLDGCNRVAVAFAWVAGSSPVADPGTFRTMGRLAARLHAHARCWELPPDTARPSLALSVTGWGDWRRSPDLPPGGGAVIERALERADLAENRTSVDPSRFGLIHTDLRIANLLRTADGAMVVLDFDDSAFGPFAADFAGSASFLEHEGELPVLARAWCEGYAEVGGDATALRPSLAAATLRRRVDLLAWIASHADAPLARTLADGFAAGTVAVAEAFLSGRLLAD